MKWFAIIIATLLCAGTVTCVRANYRADMLNTGVERVRVGMSTEALTKMLGQPSWTGQCGEKMGPAIPGCSKELGYAFPFAPILPQYFVVYFDANGRLMSSYMFHSP